MILKILLLLLCVLAPLDAGDDGRWTLLAAAHSTKTGYDFNWHGFADIDSYPGYKAYALVILNYYNGDGTPGWNDFALTYADTVQGNGQALSGAGAGSPWSTQAMFIETLAGNHAGEIGVVQNGWCYGRVLGDGSVYWKDEVNNEDCAAFLIGGR